MVNDPTSTRPPVTTANTPTATAVSVDASWDDRISWGAIIAGLVCALALQALLTLLGAAWGFATIDPTEEVNPFAGLALGAGAWWFITSLISLFVGGLVAGRTAGLPLTPSSVIHGICVWALATLATLWMATSVASSVASGAANVAQSATSATASGVASAADMAGDAIASTWEDELAGDVNRALRQRDLTEEDIRLELREMYREVLSESERRRMGNIAQNTAQDIIRTPGDFSSDVSTALDRMFGGGNAVLSEQDKEELMTSLRERFDLTEREAERIANRWENRWIEAGDRVEAAYTEAKAATAEATEFASEKAAQASFGTFLAGFFGLIAAAIGGALGRPKTLF